MHQLENKDKHPSNIWLIDGKEVGEGANGARGGCLLTKSMDTGCTTSSNYSRLVIIMQRLDVGPQ